MSYVFSLPCLIWLVWFSLVDFDLDYGFLDLLHSPNGIIIDIQPLTTASLLLFFEVWHMINIIK
jgi:hypothetical protein